MTVVNIDVSNVASSFHEDDKVIFYAPTHRSASGGGVTNTAPETVPLVGGKASVDLKPGPVLVRMQCRGIADTAPKLGTIPDVGPAALDDVLAGAYHYDPPVVSRVEQLASEVRENLGLARQAVEDVSGQAEQAAEDAATTATEQALATAALYTGTGFPEGKVAAPVGAVYTDTAATMGAIRWIKTSGTGATGWTVEYGDTGERVIYDFLSGYTSSNSGRFLSRTNESFRLDVVGRLLDTKGFAAGDVIGTLPAGFRPRRNYYVTIPTGNVVLSVQTNGQVSVISGSASGYVTFALSHSTSEAWVATLPSSPV